MKKSSLLVLFITCAFLIAACKGGMEGELGPEGPEGPEGPAGPPGTGIGGPSNVPFVANEAGHERITNALLKLKRGENITFAAIGGSITQGGCVDGVAAWLDEKTWDIGNEVIYLNRGIGASDSGVGLLRFQDHVLRHDPDIVILEYSVNDSFYFYYNGKPVQQAVYNPIGYADTYEALVRQALKGSDRAVFCLLVNTSYQGFAGFAPAHTPQWSIGVHYNLPVFRWLDYEKECWWANTDDPFNPLLDEDSRYYGDIIHPNWKGNESISRMITEYLDRIWDSLPEEGYDITTTLRAAKYSDDFENIAFIDWKGADLFGQYTNFSITKGTWEEFTDLKLNDRGGVSVTNGDPDLPDGMVPMLPNSVWGGIKGSNGRWDQFSTLPFKNISGFVSKGNDESEIKITFTGAKAVYFITTFIGSNDFHGSPGGDKYEWAEYSARAILMDGTKNLTEYPDRYRNCDGIHLPSRGYSDRDYFGKLVLDKLDPSKSYNLIIRATDQGKSNIWGVVIGY